MIGFFEGWLHSTTTTSPLSSSFAFVLVVISSSSSLVMLEDTVGMEDDCGGFVVGMPPSSSFWSDDTFVVVVSLDGRRQQRPMTISFKACRRCTSVVLEMMVITDLDVGGGVMVVLDSNDDVFFFLFELEETPSLSILLFEFVVVDVGFAKKDPNVDCRDDFLVVVMVFWW